MSAAPQRIVVTGGAGFIGSHLVDALLAAGADVHVVDDLSTGRAERVPADAMLHRLDVSDVEGLRSLVAESGPFACWYHLAAQADVRVSVEDPMGDARTNVLGTIAVLEAAALDEAQVMFVSTGGAMYGEVDPPTPEDAREQPESPYGAAKLAAEGYVATDARLRGRPHAIVRFANVYGPRQDPHGEAGVVAIFGGRVLAGESATIFGDGTQTRDYVYVADAVAATLAAARVAAARPRDAWRDVPVWNVGTGVETSVLDLWRAVTAAGNVELVPHFNPARAGELTRSALDATRARTDLGVPLDTPLADGLAHTLAWMRSGVVGA